MIEGHRELDLKRLAANKQGNMSEKEDEVDIKVVNIFILVFGLDFFRTSVVFFFYQNKVNTV